MKWITIDAHYRVVTPLFMAGADQTRFELREASFKGVLRFWWRALAWPRFEGDLARIHEEEEVLFGSASAGQSRVSLRINPDAKLNLLRPPQQLRLHSKVVGEGVRYLGYGLMEAFGSKKKGTKDAELLRPAALPPLSFHVQLRLRDVNSTDLESVVSSLKLMGLVGGFGARSRRGFGSLVLNELTANGQQPWLAPKDTDGLKQELRRFLQDATESLPEYTAISRKSRILILETSAPEPTSALDTLGRELIRFRSWGHNGVILGKEKTEETFKDDHDLMNQPPPKRTGHPRRIVFGLPHNYGKSADQQVRPASKDTDRRASPLFFHVHESGDKIWIVVAFFPARFLPDHDGKPPQISVGGKHVPLKPERELWEPIHEFLNRLKHPQKRKEQAIQSVMEVS